MSSVYLSEIDKNPIHFESIWKELELIYDFLYIHKFQFMHMHMGNTESRKVKM